MVSLRQKWLLTCISLFASLSQAIVHHQSPPALIGVLGLGLGFRVGGLELSVSLYKWIEYGVYGDLSIIFPKPYSIYLRGRIGFES